ncbi:MAG: hypothetical protein K6D91_06080 [Prevotella sp.]|nr:hypothetical protein [Prevotella sp.]
MNQEIRELIAENNRRRQEIFGPYDPFTGFNCYGFKEGDRVHVTIPDLYIGEDLIKDMWVPKETLETVIWNEVLRYGSIQKYVENGMGRDYDEDYHMDVIEALFQARFIDDPEFAMFMTDKIVHKITGNLTPFRLRYAQRVLIAVLEGMRKAGIPIRVVLLKARQWGGSTLVQMYIKWMQDYRHPNGWNAAVVTQVGSTSKKIKAMYRKAIESQQGWTLGLPGTKFKMLPYEGSDSDFIVSDGRFAVRSNVISVASFENYEKLRGDNYKCLHYSEVAIWKKTPEHDPEGVLSAASQSLIGLPDEIEVFESTGMGNSGFFYDLCQDAMKENSTSAYRFLFIPFFMIENDMEPKGDKGFNEKQQEEFATWLWENRNNEQCPPGYRETGKFFWKMWKLGACFEAINWYRIERNKHRDHAHMATEAPIDPEEAFRNSGNLVFDPYSIDALKEECKPGPPKYYANIVLPPFERRNDNVYLNAKINFRNDNQGDLKIWATPNNHIFHVKNRYLVSVDIGGKSDTSDYTVMTVIDQMGLCPEVKGRPRVVARWRGHVRHDILAWTAAALAHYYDDATLIIESNTADRERENNTEGDHFGTIIEEIAGYYPNLYQRTKEPEATSEGIKPVYGFQTNKLTKGWIIDNLIACVDDKLWEEPDAEMYKELRWYERREDGSMGNKVGSGKHDDILMSTAIGLWVAFNATPYKPSWGTVIERKRETRELTEASF